MSLLQKVFVLLLSLYYTTTNGIIDADTLKMAWYGVTEIYARYAKEEKAPPVLMLVFWDDISKMDHMMPVLWDEDINWEIMSTTPLQELKAAVPEVLKSYSRKDSITPSKCKLYYRFGEGRVEIDSDKIIADLLTLAPDYTEGRRRVFVDCPGVAEQCTEQCAESDAEAISNQQYQLAMNAYRYAKGHQITRDEDKIEQYEEELEDMGIASFQIESKAFQVVRQTLKSYSSQIKSIGESFHWEDEMMNAALAAPHADTTFKANNWVEFDQPSWTLRGNFKRWATTLDKSVPDDVKISYNIVTSTFEFKIPESGREQTMVQKWITGDGTVSRKFTRRIKYLIKADGMQAGNENMFEPNPNMFN